MAINNKISSLLTETDYNYLAKAYGLSLDFVYGMDDLEWCAFLGCESSELVYYLFDGTEDFADALFDEEPEEAEDWGDTEGTLFDLSDYLERQFLQEKTVPLATASEYSRPSKYAKKKSKPKVAIVVSHHFELVK